MARSGSVLRPRCARLFACFLLAGAWAPAAAFDGWRFAGYNKSMLVRSRTVMPPADDFTLLLNRTRLKLSYVVPESLELHVENDTELRAGDYLGTAQAQAEAAHPTRSYWDLQSTWLDGDRRRITNDFFRAYAKASIGPVDVKAGRQRIAIGTGRLWSTLDMLNPLNPLQIERDEYVGVDAALAELRMASLSKLSLAYAPLPGSADPRWVGAWRTHVGEADVNLTAARYWGDHLAGLDLATQVGGIGVRAEFTGTWPRHGTRYVSTTIGGEYAFENTLTVSVEAYYSSQPLRERRGQFLTEPSRAQAQPAGTRYVGFTGSYEFTPLLKTTAMWLANLNDHSRFASVSLAWSASDNLLLQGGVQRFFGDDDSEYGRGQPLAYLQLQWFF